MSKKQTKIQGPVLMTRRFLSPQEPPQRLFTVLIFTSARAFQTCAYVRSNLHAMVFPVVTYGYESWTIKKAESWRIDVFELWCWRRLLRVPWTARISNRSIRRRTVLGGHWKDWCWNWSFNPLATCCEELTHWKRPRCWERLKAGGEGGDRGWDG